MFANSHGGGRQDGRRHDTRGYAQGSPGGPGGGTEVMFGGECRPVAIEGPGGLGCQWCERVAHIW